MTIKNVKTVLIGLLMLLSQSLLAQTYLHVGESVFLEIPDYTPTQTAVVASAHWSADEHIRFESSGPYGAIIEITHYFTGIEHVSVDYAFTWVDKYNHTLANYATKTYSIKCTPIYVSLSESSITLKTGEKRTITTSLPYSDVGWSHGVRYDWEIADDSVAKITPSNDYNSVTIEALRKGNTVLRLDPIVGPVVTCSINVEANPPTKIDIIPESLSIKEGKKGQLSCKFTPEDSYADVTWSSSDPDVATVNSYGLVTAVAAGKATITAQTENGLHAEATVSVTPTPKKVTLDNSYTIVAGYTKVLKPIVTPSDAETTFKWTSSDTRVAKVDAAGNLKGINEGNATITVTTDNGVTATANVNVLAADKGKDSRTVKQRIKVLRELIKTTTGK